jgi:predicted RNA methylase
MTIRDVSSSHWTPVAVAVRAAALLAPRPGMRVLDVGAGPGKLCCIGALVSDASWYGVERSVALVGSARQTAEALGVGMRATFETADVIALGWDGFDSVYLFNPFEGARIREQSAHLTAWIRYLDEIEGVKRKLAGLRSGTLVVTYNGFGAEMPTGFARLSSESIGIGTLALWEKRT